MTDPLRLLSLAVLSPTGLWVPLAARGGALRLIVSADGPIPQRSTILPDGRREVLLGYGADGGLGVYPPAFVTDVEWGGE